MHQKNMVTMGTELKEKRKYNSFLAHIFFVFENLNQSTSKNIEIAFVFAISILEHFLWIIFPGKKTFCVITVSSSEKDNPQGKLPKESLHQIRIKG